MSEAAKTSESAERQLAAKTSEAAKMSVSSEACEDMRVEKWQRRGGGDGDDGSGERQRRVGGDGDTAVGGHFDRFPVRRLISVHCFRSE